MEGTATQDLIQEGMAKYEAKAPYPEVIAAFEKALTGNKDQKGTALTCLSWLHTLNGDAAKGVKAAKEALKLDRTNAQASNATHITANSRGTAKASGRAIDSPSVRPGPAKLATVRPYSGTARLTRTWTCTQYRQCRTWTTSHSRVNASATAVSGTKTPRAGSLL